MDSWKAEEGVATFHKHTLIHACWPHVKNISLTQLDSPIMTHLVSSIKSFIHPLLTNYLCIWDYSKADMYWETISVAECLLLDNCNRYKDNNQLLDLQAIKWKCLLDLWPLTHTHTQRFVLVFIISYCCCCKALAMVNMPLLQSFYVRVIS